MLRLFHQVALCNGYMKDVTALVIAHSGHRHTRTICSDAASQKMLKGAADAWFKSACAKQCLMVAEGKRGQ